MSQQRHRAENTRQRERWAQWRTGRGVTTWWHAVRMDGRTYCGRAVPEGTKLHPATDTWPSTSQTCVTCEKAMERGPYACRADRGGW
jgi:hypothetical protein